MYIYKSYKIIIYKDKKCYMLCYISSAVNENLKVEKIARVLIKFNKIFFNHNDHI